MTNVLRTEDFDSSRRRVGCLCIPSLVRLGKAVKRAFTRKPRKPFSVQASAGSGQSVFLDRLSSLVETRVAEVQAKQKRSETTTDYASWIRGIHEQLHHPTSKWSLPAAYACPPPYGFPTSLAPPHPPLICTTRKPYKEAALISGSEYKEPLKLDPIPPVPHLDLAEDTFAIAKASVQQEAGKVETAPPSAACLATAIPTSATKLTEAAAVVQERSAPETEKGPDPPQKKLDVLPPILSPCLGDDHGTAKKSRSPTSPVSTKVSCGETPKTDFFPEGLPSPGAPAPPSLHKGIPPPPKGLSSSGAPTPPSLHKGIPLPPKRLSSSGAPTPPPLRKGIPPPPPRLVKSASKIVHQKQVVTLFQRYVRGGKMLNTAVKKPSKGPQGSASLFLEELESRSSRKKMIQEDAVTFREGLANLAKEIEEAKPKNMPQLVELVQSADAYLDKLVDEHEVLKLVPWPDRFGLMREATKLFSDLMAIKAKLGTWRTSARSVEEELEAMEKFTRATVERMDLLQQKETTVAEKFTKVGLPWKVGVWKEVRSAALHLLAQYTTLVLQAANRDLSSSRSARLLKGAIAFTYLVHAFVGGLCPRCTQLFSTLVEVAQKCLPPLQ